MAEEILLEARNSSFSITGIIDTAQSVIWHSVYYGVGDFEIYIRLDSTTFYLLESKYITRQDNSEVGIVERIEITESISDGRMIAISGRFAKSLLDRRIIYDIANNSNTFYTLYGKVEEQVRNLVSSNIVSCTNQDRNISILALDSSSGLQQYIVDKDGNHTTKQVAMENLLEYSDSVLQEYGMSATVSLKDGVLYYKIYKGLDKSDTVVFSKDFDNLSSSNYTFDSSKEKTVSVIGGEGEGAERFYAVLGTSSGLDRKEEWLDSGSTSRTYDNNGTEAQYTDSAYEELLLSAGKQSLAESKAVETFNGDIDVTYGNFKYGTDFSLGDIVALQDNDIGKYAIVRITEVTEVQDENGITISVVYKGE